MIDPFQSFFALFSLNILTCCCIIKIFTFLWFLDLVIAFHDLLKVCPLKATLNNMGVAV